MTGKASVGQRKPDNRGGRREGAGRKPGREALSVRQLREFEAAAKKLAEEHGYTLAEGIGRMFYDESIGLKERLAAGKLFLDKWMIPVSEGGDADQQAGPSVYLPEQRPQLEVVEIPENRKSA